jgi:hypothetical protein
MSTLLQASIAENLAAQHDAYEASGNQLSSCESGSRSARSVPLSLWICSV